MPHITIYTKDYCPYCTRAKMFLKNKGASFEEIDITRDANLQAEVVEKSGGRRTVPQIFINDKPIGGFDDMVALDKNGELEKLLAS